MYKRQGRYNYDNYNSEFVIKTVQKSDEGDYKCEASNVAGRDSYTMQIDVQCTFTRFNNFFWYYMLLFNASDYVKDLRSEDKDSDLQ